MSEDVPRKPLLLLALQEDDWDCVSLLLRARADPLLPSEDGALYAFDYLSESKKQTCVLDYVGDVNAPLRNGESILARTLRQRKPVCCVRNLMERGAHPSQPPDSRGRPPFFQVQDLGSAKALLPGLQKRLVLKRSDTVMKLRQRKKFPANGTGIKGDCLRPFCHSLLL